MAYDTLQFNTKIIRITWQNLKILTLSLQSSLYTVGISENLYGINNNNVPSKNANIYTTINATDIKISKYNYRMDLHIPVYFGKNPMKTFIFICIFVDSRKSKKSAIWLICLHSDMLSIWQNSIQAFAKIIKP